jgi:glycosyltransferase A (GT-A) superfamily protein (DUF2064 family)
MEKVVIIGSDSPGLPSRYLEEALDRLAHADIVLGPSRDGGYYLIGLSKSLRPQIFQNVSWSTNRVLDQTLEAAKNAGSSVELLPEYFDIDTFDDLERFPTINSHPHASISFTRKIAALAPGYHISFCAVASASV